MPGIDTWHVMISSTMSDLVDERNTVASAIAEAGMQVWRAEQPPARLLGLTPERFCQRMAEECDLYVLIVGARYGYIPTEQSPLNDLSITHLEYRWARSANRRKVLVYLTDDSLHTSDERQKQFVEEVQDFHLGYLRPQPFASLPYLHLLLVGDPGTGKSILVRQLAHTLALQALETPDLFQASIPLCINAQQLSEVLEAKASLV